MSMLERRLYFHIDWALVVALFALCGMGVLMIYSATQSSAPRLYISQLYALGLGTVALGHQVSLGYYAQEHEGISAGRNVLAHMRDVSAEPDQYLRSLLGMFGLHGEIVFQDASTLSGGEKTRLALAMIVVSGANVLLLDEPTNNLDPASRAEILDALAHYEGSVVLVSHDPGAVEALNPERVLIMPDGTEDHWSREYQELIELA